LLLHCETNAKHACLASFSLLRANETEAIEKLFPPQQNLLCPGHWGSDFVLGSRALLLARCSPAYHGPELVHSSVHVFDVLAVQLVARPQDLVYLLRQAIVELLDLRKESGETLSRCGDMSNTRPKMRTELAFDLIFTCL
jgi:hypothetical protein